MPEAVIVATARTPIARAFKGSLLEVRADDLAAFIVNALMEKVPGVDRASVEDVIMGAANHSGEQGYNMARNISSLAGLPDVPGTSVNRMCASSLQSIRMAFHAIRAGEGDAFVAAGVESISQVPGYPKDESELHPALLGDDAPIANVYIPMGLTAENVAERYGVTREEQDEWAAISQQRAVAAQEAGHFDAEIVGVTVAAHKDWDKEGNELDVPETVVTKDDGPRPGTTAEGLSGLRPAFKPDGTVTAGNACPLNDGAAALLITSDEKAEKLGLTPRARIIATSVAGLDPEYMGVGPIPAIQKLLAATGKKIEDIDIVEINEAFAAQIVPCMKELGISKEQLNPFGGAIALGHPFGMTGARIATTLINGLEKTGGKYGIESMCVAGGLGMAMLIERI